MKFLPKIVLLAAFAIVFQDSAPLISGAFTFAAVFEFSDLLNWLLGDDED